MVMINTSKYAAFGTMATYVKAILTDNQFYVH